MNGQTIELIEVSSNGNQPIGARLMGFKVSNVKSVRILYNGELLEGKLAYLDAEDNGFKTIAILGVNNELCAYLKCKQVGDAYFAEYFTSGHFKYMSASIKKSQINIYEKHRLPIQDFSNARTSGWASSFGFCVDSFVSAVNSDAELGAIMTVGEYAVLPRC